MFVGEFDEIKIFVDEEYDEKDFMAKFNKPEILKYTTLSFPLKEEFYSENKLYDVKKEKRFIFKKDGEIVGSSDLYDIEENHKATIRFWIAQEYQGQGIGSRAISEIVAYGFNKLNLKRIDGYVFTENVGSYKLLEKVGFTREGLLKNFDKKCDTLVDEYIYAIYS